MRRILVLRGGALGDLIVTLPALALLRRRWPEAHIALIGNTTAARLALTRGDIGGQGRVAHVGCRVRRIGVEAGAQ